MYLTNHQVYINQIATFLPNQAVDNEQIETILGRVGNIPSRTRKMILRSNAITHRYYAIDPISRQSTHTVTEMAALAIKQLIQNGVDSQKITSLACATSYPDQILPGHGVMVHGLLPELPSCEVFSHAGVCIAGMAAMKHAYNAIKTGEHQHTIASAAEAASAILRSEMFRTEINYQQHHHSKPEIGFHKDFLRWMLSDGAGAVYLSNQPNKNKLSFKIHWIDIFSYANEMPVCMYAGAEIQHQNFTSWKYCSPQEREQQSFMSIKQDVKLLNEHIIHYTIEKPLTQLIEKYQLKAEQIQWFLPHYSSGFFKDKVASALENIRFPLSQDKWFTNLSQKGNTGSASIYIILEEFMRTFPIKAGDKILCYIPESGRFSTCFMLLEAIYAN